MTYTLKTPWSLRGWKDAVCCLTDGHNIQRLGFSDFSLLFRCNGRTDIQPSEQLNKWLEKGAIEESCEPLSSGQAYELYPWVLRERAQWAITGECNYRCRHCFTSTGTNDSTGCFTLDQCRDIIAQMYFCGVRTLELTGGEPLMHPEFVQIVKAAHEVGIIVDTILTNGAMITEKLLDELQKLHLKPLFKVSFDGLGTHDWMRNHDGAEQITLNAMELLHKSGFPVMAQVNLNRMTQQRLTETCRMLATRFGAALRIIRTGETPCWVDGGFEQMTLSYAECCEAELELAQAALSENWGVNILGFNGFQLRADGNMKKVFQYWDKEHDIKGGLFNSCIACRRIFIAHDGRVIPCDVFEGISAVCGGFLDCNVLKRPLKEILMDSEYTRVHELTIKDFVCENPECGSCVWLDVCRGGCRAHAYGASMYLGKGYGAGESSHLCKAGTNCTFFSGGYADRLRELCEKSQQRNCKHSLLPM